MSSIRFDNVCKAYDGAAVNTISNLSLDIAPGEFSVFVGPSGCGKSTVLRMVAGLEDISSGTIAIEGQVVNQLAPAQRGVAMVFQSYALYPHMTVAENMAFGLKVTGVKESEVEKRVQEAARMLQLDALLNRLPKALSGGQRQRVAIGRAIVKQPKVFLFDEPLSNLDASLRGQTRVELAKLHKGLGNVSAIYVTHDQVEAMTLADRIVLLRAGDDARAKGSVAQAGSPMTLYHHPANRFVAEFMGSPAMNMLDGCLLNANETQAQIATGTHTVQAQVDARRLSVGAPVTLGIRPEHLRLGAQPNACVLNVRVDHIERLGDASLIYCGVAERESPVIIKQEGQATVKVGDRTALSLPPSEVHLFDSDGLACTRLI